MKLLETKKFIKEYSKLKVSGRKSLIKNVDKIVVNLQNKHFTPSMQVHPLQGKLVNWWDAHVSGDYVIIYKYNETTHQLIVDNLGNHESLNLESLNDFSTTELRLWETIC